MFNQNLELLKEYDESVLKDDPEKMFDKFKYYEEEIINIKSSRHSIHSMKSRHIFNDNGEELSDDIEYIIYNIEKIKIINGKEYINKLNIHLENVEELKTLTDMEYDIDVNTEDDEYDEIVDQYMSTSFNIIHNFKEKVNKDIEDYLSELDDLWNKYNLDDLNYGIEKIKTPFCPSGYLRGRGYGGV